MTPHREAEGTVEAGAPAREAEATTKAHTAPPKPRVAPRKSNAATRPHHPVKKKAKSAKPVKTPHHGSKTARILDLLKRPQGVTLKELMKATGWQPHSVRGFLSGTVGKKLGLTVASVRDNDGERRYSVKH
jgi:hypothetical protein